MLATTAVATLLAIACAGCARTAVVAGDGERRSHPTGFSVVIPEGWTWTTHDGGLRLVGLEKEGGGYPTLLIEVVPASELPEEFLEGRSFDWTHGKGTFDYDLWSNGMGHGDALTVHLVSDELSMIIEVERWSDGLFVNRRFYRREVWPIINSIEIGEE